MCGRMRGIKVERKLCHLECKKKERLEWTCYSLSSNEKFSRWLMKIWAISLWMGDGSSGVISLSERGASPVLVLSISVTEPGRLMLTDGSGWTKLGFVWKNYERMKWGDKCLSQNEVCMIRQAFLFSFRDEMGCSWWKQKRGIKPAVLLVLVMTLSVGAKAEDRVTAMKRWFRKKSGNDSAS